MFKNLFTIIGGSVAVVGVGLAIGGIAFGSGDDRLGMVIPGVFMVAFGLFFYRTGARIGRLVWTGRKVLETGLPGRGTITRMWETGVTINDQPVFGFELDLEVDGLPPGTASVQQVVPRMLAGAVLPGHSVAVKVDREDSSEVVIDWSETPVAAADPGAGRAPGSAEIAEALGAALRERGGGGVEPPESAADLLRSGRRGTATLTSVADVGEIGELGLAGGDSELEDDRLYVIGMDVKLPGRSPYPAQIGHRVPDRLIGRIGPGLQVPVAVDRDDDQSVAIDWVAVLPPGGDHPE